MKINLLSKENYKILLDAFTNFPNLVLQNKGYETIDKDILTENDKLKIAEINKILKETIFGFKSFSNFKVNAKNEIVVRVQYNYNYEGNEVPFVGVGYVLLDNLLNGFI